jgi:hypothetical protein
MTNFDPTTNRVPFGLLSVNEQKTMKAWPHGWEYYLLDEWRSIDLSSWCWNVVYRGKPAPVVTSVWQNIYVRGACESLSKSRESADKHSGGRIGILRIDTCNGVSTAHLEVD